MLDRLTDVVIHHRRWVVGIWLALTLFGMFAAGQVADRWLQTFSIPGNEAYEANQRASAALGSGEFQPFVAVIRANDGRDVTTISGVQESIAKATAALPGARATSYFNTKSDLYLSADRRLTYALIYAPGKPGFGVVPDKPVREALQASAPADVTVNLTGTLPLYADASGGNTAGPSVLVEAMIGGLGALIILLFTFGTLPAVVLPLMVAVASIFQTFTLVWLLTYLTDVSIIVQFLIALVGLGVAIDYSLLMIFRFREEIRHGADNESAIRETMRHAGHSVIVSGTTVAVGLLSMIIIPLPFIRSIGIGGMLIPAVSVVAAITLLPAMLFTLGPRINRLRVMPRVIVEGSDDMDAGFWNRWAGIVLRHPAIVAITGTVIVGVLVFFGVQMNPSDAQSKDLPGAGDAHSGYTALIDAGITEGVTKPFFVVVEGPAARGDLTPLVTSIAETDGITGAAVPASAIKGDLALIEAIPTVDGSANAIRPIIKRLHDETLPALESTVPGSTLTLGGFPTEERGFISTTYGTFPWVLSFVVILTFILLMRAFRSLVLPIKAVILNLVSLAAAFGIIVIIFQNGHGSERFWGVPATDSIISWIPLMIFAFLFGLSMDYEVFMLTRMREGYDETGSTSQAIALGLSRTGKLVTSAALVLMFAFFVLSTGPGTDIKQFGIGLAAGIIFDATIIRALLAPALMRLMGRWNWWLPAGLAKVLHVKPSPLPAAGEDR